MRRTTLAQQIQEMTEALSRPRYLRITAEFLVHESKKGPRCPCCRSTTAAIVERIPAGDLVLDLEIGDRFTEQDLDAQTWQDLCGLAQHHQIPIRCSRNQLPFLLDSTGRHLFASGSQRSGKTSVGLYWLALQWIRRGGFERRFWLVASTLPKSFRLLQKLFLGDADSPAVLPRELVVYLPRTHRASDTQTRLVDGSVIDLKYFDGDPSAERLKSDPIIAALIDEASHLPGEDSLIALRGRCQDHAGRLFFSSTPRPESFFKASVVDPAQEFERLPDTDPRKINGQHEGARYSYSELPIIENPWLDQDAVAAELATLDTSKPSVQRDYFGKWVGSSGPLWLDYSPDKHLVTHEARDFKDLGGTYLAGLGLSNQVDITAQCADRVFFGINPHYRAIKASNKRFILGTDVNVHPMSTVLLQVSADRDQPDNRDKWHYWAIDVVRTSHGSSYAHADQLAQTYFGRVLQPGSTESPLKGCGLIIDAKAIHRDPTIHKFGGDPAGIVELFGRKGFDVRAPQYTPSDKGPRGNPPNRWDCYLLVHRLLREGRLHVSQRCESLTQGFALMQDSGNGIEPIKDPPLDSAMDGLRYALWAIAHAPVRESFDRLR